MSLRLEGESFKRVLALGGGADAKKTPAPRSAPRSPRRREGWLGDSGLPVHLTAEPAAQQAHALAGALPPPAARDRAPAGRAGRRALQRSARGRRRRRGRALQAGRGLAAGKPVRPRRAGRNERAAARRRLAHAEPRLRGRRPRPDVAVARRNGPVGKRPGDAAELPRQPARHRLRPERPGARLRRGHERGRRRAACCCATARPGPKKPGSPPRSRARASPRSRSPARRRSSPTQAARPSPRTFVGGLLVNDGSGWQIDQEAEPRRSASAFPQAVAGLPDGGAAFVDRPAGDGRSVYEREAAARPGSAAPTPLPARRPGRSRCSAKAARCARSSRPAASAWPRRAQSRRRRGSRRILTPPSALAERSPKAAACCARPRRLERRGPRTEPGRQPPEGSYIYHDLPYRPDPDPRGADRPDRHAGLGGRRARQRTRTAARPATSSATRPTASTPLGAGAANRDGAARHPTSIATFAIGGGAQCAAPCADRAAHASARRVAGARRSRTSRARIRRAGVPLHRPARHRRRNTGEPRTPVDPLRRTSSTATPMILASRRRSPSTRHLARRPRRAPRTATAPRRRSSRRSPASPAVRRQGRELEQGCERHGRLPAALLRVARREGGRAGDRARRQLTATSDPTQLRMARGASWRGAESGQRSRRSSSATPTCDAQIAAHDDEATALFEALVGDSPAIRQGAPRAAVASAYFYDAPEENVQQAADATARQQIPTFGSGTLGYVNVPPTKRDGDFHGASGILLGQVEPAARTRATNRAPVSVRLIPVDRRTRARSQGRDPAAAQRAGAVRRARAAPPRGLPGPVTDDTDSPRSTPTSRSPSDCVGRECATGLLPEYTFTSSDPEVGQFVERNRRHRPSPLAVLQNAEGEPIPDEPEPQPHREPQVGAVLRLQRRARRSSRSARAGCPPRCRSPSRPGSVRQPCGTVPLKHCPAASSSRRVPPPAPAPGPRPGRRAASTPPPVPLPPPPALRAAAPGAPPRTAPPPPFFPLAALAAPLLAFVPPPVPTPGPPDARRRGTSAVTSPVEVAEHEEEEEEATESVSNQARRLPRLRTRARAPVPSRDRAARRARRRLDPSPPTPWAG